MVKRKTVRQKIGRKEAKKQPEKDAEVASSFSEDMEPGSSRVKRKLTKQMQFLSRLQETQTVLGTRKTISKKKHRRKKSALNNLSGLAEVLPSFEECIPKQPHLLRRNQAKARQQLVVSEAEQLSKVLGHPQFKANPFTAIHEHLVNTLGPVLEDKAKPLMKKGKEKKSKQKRKAMNNAMEE
ncbi:hypothetical protein GOP47_0013449 [Adiantum capillus-veneris]|uniref:Ribosome biogenesis protein SLX9 n=1 Tax=Adiantum capillus-veneris TaxID=13818 RepID=A0A9D4ZD76_ADICA|nr:hypothetical protein GOP47_0013449 [Adiantum capillus-veneris]